jgi:hypothetical protein
MFVGAHCGYDDAVECQWRGNAHIAIHDALASGGEERNPKCRKLNPDLLGRKIVGVWTQLHQVTGVTGGRFLVWGTAGGWLAGRAPLEKSGRAPVCDPRLVESNLQRQECGKLSTLGAPKMAPRWMVESKSVPYYHSLTRWCPRPCGMPRHTLVSAWGSDE